MNSIVYLLYLRYRRLSDATVSEQWNMPRPGQRLPMWLRVRLQRHSLWILCVLSAYLFDYQTPLRYWEFACFTLSCYFDTPKCTYIRTISLDFKDCHDLCQNNGTCLDLVNDYRCECITGFNGTNCENGEWLYSIYSIYNVRTLSMITNVTLQRASMGPSVTRYARGLPWEYLYTTVEPHLKWTLFSISYRIYFCFNKFKK